MAARDCGTGCPIKVEAVCGANGVSYMNACLAKCSGQTRITPGYCKGAAGSGRAFVRAAGGMLCVVNALSQPQLVVRAERDGRQPNSLCADGPVKRVGLWAQVTKPLGR